MKILHEVGLLGCLAGVSFCFIPSSAEAWRVNTSEIYSQARAKNYQYLNLIRRYSGVIDVADKEGNTAYCLSMKYGDKKSGKILAEYGANVNHPCAKKVAEQQEEALRKEKARQNEKKHARTAVNSSDDNSKLLIGAGILAAGAGVVALASGGGGGGGSHISGDAHGPGGSDGNGGDDSGNAGLPEKTVDPKVFKTSEYKNGNFLESIHAAEAYSYMYKSDSHGNLQSHQANSHDALKRIKVGLIDTGIIENEDIKGKLRPGIDLNNYNSLGNVFGCIQNKVENYVFKHDNKYYLLRLIDNGNGGYNVAYGEGDNSVELDKLLQKYNLTFNDFTVMNSGNSSNPGTSLIEGFRPLPQDGVGINEVLTEWLDIAHNLNHGTHIAGIIAGNKNNQDIHGVAFENSEILGVSWDMETKLAGTVKKIVDDGVSVINASWGITTENGISAKNIEDFSKFSDGRDKIEAYAYLAKNKGVWVNAAGNEGYNDAVIEAGMGNLSKETLKEFGYEGPGKYEVPLLSVVALDPQTKDKYAPAGRLASFSNQCGSTSGYCIAAPGDSINSTGAVEKGTFEMSGTSMSAPVVTGSIALLMGYYPWLSAQNVSYILLETANKEGVYSNTQIYGQGALDLEAAVTTPIGGLNTPTTDSVNNTIPVGYSKVSLSGVMQNKMLKAMPEKIVVFDDLKRPFDYDTKKMVNKTHASNVNLRREVSKIALGNNKRVIKDNKNGLLFATEQTTDKGGNAYLTTAEVVRKTDNAMSRFYYAENSKYMENENVLVPSTNPYLAMNDAYGAENMFKLSDKSKLKLSLQTGENGLYERDYEQDNHAFKERAYSLSGEYSFNLTDYLELATVGGMLFEDEALLGMNGTGGMGIDDTATYFMGIKAAFNVTDNFSLLAAYYRGYTQGSEASMLSISDLQTESFMVSGEYKLSGKDKIGVVLSSPLQVVKGKAGLNYAVGRDNNSDKVLMKRLRTSLKSDAKEYDMGFYYQGQPDEDLGVTGKIQARFNADGQKGQTDYIGIIGAQYQF